MEEQPNMKLNQLQSKNPKAKPFVKTGSLEISTIMENGEIAGFATIANGYAREFKKRGDPEKAFKEMEKYLDKLL